MTKLEETKALIEAYKAGKLNKPNASIDKAKADAEKAYQDMQDARQAGDYERHKAAKRAYEEAREALDFYQGKAAEGKLISDAEYKTLKEGIHAEVDALNAEKREKVVEMLLQLDAIREELKKSLDDADHALYALQADIYKYKDAPGFLKGRMHGAWMTKAEDARLKESDFSVLLCLIDIINKARQYEILPTVRG